ncbi:Lrp/AsnC family transcriptional regulator [Halosimplex sp. J119]
MDPSVLDAVDRAILYHLQQDARRSLTDIAEAVGVTANTVRNRISDLEAEGVIEGYQVNVNYDSAGVQHYFMFVCSAPVSRREKLAEMAKGKPGVVEVLTLMTGRNNVYILAAETEKEAITDLAFELDEAGLDIESEHLIKHHERIPFAGFRLDETV